MQTFDEGKGKMTERWSFIFSKPAALVLGVVLGAAGLGIAHTTQREASNPPATVKVAEANEGPSKNLSLIHISEPTRPY